MKCICAARHATSIFLTRADSVVIVRADGYSEKNPAKKLDGNLFQIMCQAITSYDVDLHDVVRVDGRGVVESTERKPQYTSFRVMFSSGDDERLSIIEQLRSAGVIVDFDTESEIVCLAVHEDAQPSAISGFLSEQEDNGLLEFETVRTHPSGTITP